MLYRSISAVGVLMVSAGMSSALTVSLDDDAANLATSTLGGGSGISISAGSQSLIGEASQQGTYTGFNQASNSSDPDLVLTDGVVLTTGLGDFSTTENTSGSAAALTSTDGFAPLVALGAANGLSTSQFDSNVLSFDFTLDDPTHNSVSAQFIFATDEYPTESITDIMGIFVNGVNYAFFQNGDLVSHHDEDPNGIFNNNPIGSTAADGYGLEWDGVTRAFDIVMLANGDGATNTIEIAIADTDDRRFDSAVFFTNLKGGTTTTDGGIDPDEIVGVPIPASLPLLLAGLGTIAALRRRRNQH